MIYIYICTYIHTYIHTHIHTLYMYICIYKYAYMFLSLSLYIYIHICIVYTLPGISHSSRLPSLKPGEEGRGKLIRIFSVYDCIQTVSVYDCIRFLCLRFLCIRFLWIIQIFSVYDCILKVDAHIKHKHKKEHNNKQTDSYIFTSGEECRG